MPAIAIGLVPVESSLFTYTYPSNFDNTVIEEFRTEINYQNFE